jgi:predicted NAD-dependent protein-ADP-ribosyltransferase YbiA (DUF1768 family)
VRVQPIKIQMGTDFHRYTADLDACVFGMWAAHVTVSNIDGSRWTVTHVQSGMALPFYEDVTEREAMSTARILSECHVTGRSTDTKLVGPWRCVLEAVCGLKAEGAKLPWIGVSP